MSKETEENRTKPSRIVSTADLMDAAEIARNAADIIKTYRLENINSLPYAVSVALVKEARRLRELSDRLEPNSAN